MSAYLGKPYELRAAGIKALQDVLGYEDAQEFLTLWRGIPGSDFNKWLNEQPQKSLEEWEAEIMRMQEEEEAEIASRRAKFARHAETASA
jgi:hypothetical protein